MNILVRKYFHVSIILLIIFQVTAVQADEEADTSPYGVIDLKSIIEQLPELSGKIIVDERLLDGENNGIRVFRLYKPVPAHFHEKSDTIIYLLEGEVDVAIDNRPAQRVKPGTVLHWKRGITHAVPELHDRTATFLAIDVPARDPADAVFIEGNDVEFLD